MIQQKISMLRQKISMIQHKQITDTMENTKDISIYNIKYPYGNKWIKMTRLNMENTVRKINKVSRTRWYFLRLNCVYFLNYEAFKYVCFERTWRRLFQKRGVRTKFDIYVFIFNTMQYWNPNVINKNHKQRYLQMKDNTSDG